MGLFLDLCHALDTEVKIKTAFRIGNKNDNITRPYKVVLADKNQKHQLRAVFNIYAEKCCHCFNTHGKFMFPLYVVNKHNVTIYTKIQQNLVKFDYNITYFSRVITVKPARRLVQGHSKHAPSSPRERSGPHTISYLHQ